MLGEADPGAAAAVFSLVRLRAGGEAFDRDHVLGRRSTIEGIHELAHTYGLGHRDDAGCVMWFSNTLAETDAKGPDLCPRHAHELHQALARSGREAHPVRSA